jgi:hypothetical protein
MKWLGMLFGAASRSCRSGHHAQAVTKLFFPPPGWQPPPGSEAVAPRPRRGQAHPADGCSATQPNDDVARDMTVFDFVPRLLLLDLSKRH